MKLSEAIQCVEMDQNRIFRADLPEGRRAILSCGDLGFLNIDIYSYDGKLIEETSRGGCFNGNLKASCNWYEITESVGWVKAFEAWSVGFQILWLPSKINSEMKGKIFKSETLTDDNHFPLMKDMLNGGEWFIRGGKK